MIFNSIKTSSFCSRLTDLIVLSISFILFSYLVDFGNPEQLFTNMAFYVGTVFICLRACKRLFFEFANNKSRMLRILLGNVSGLLLGSILALELEHIFPNLGEKAVVVIFASLLAFFILGTLSPMVKSSHRDIIPH